MTSFVQATYLLLRRVNNQLALHCSMVYFFVYVDSPLSSCRLYYHTHWRPNFCCTYMRTLHSFIFLMVICKECLADISFARSCIRLLKIFAKSAICARFSIFKGTKRQSMADVLLSVDRANFYTQMSWPFSQGPAPGHKTNHIWSYVTISVI